jgi:hypothetical protein
MKNLNISKNQFGVGKAEFSTGLVLKNDGTYFLKELEVEVEVEVVYKVFENYKSSNEVAIEQIENNRRIDGLIINSKNEMVYCNDQNGERKVK